VIHHADAVTWLSARAALPDTSVITSLPDLSELRGMSVDTWRAWFEDAAQLTTSRVSAHGVAIFFQSDITRAGTWIDKAALVARGAERAGMHLVFHKIVCRLAPGEVSFGRPGYSHLLGYAWPDYVPQPARPTPDVIADAGFKPAAKAMGVNACAEACRFVLAQTTTRTVLDPFCGFGTVLAVANALGLDAVGVDVSKRMCLRARRLVVPEDSIAALDRGQVL
jgi:hypothetical protein